MKNKEYKEELTMEYNAIEVGPILKKIREDKLLTRERVSEKTGLSVSSIKQIEYGVRNLSMRGLYMFMEAYQCDANTLLNIGSSERDSVDYLLMRLPDEQRHYFIKTFKYMMKEMSEVESDRR